MGASCGQTCTLSFDAGEKGEKIGRLATVEKFRELEERKRELGGDGREIVLG